MANPDIAQLRIKKNAISKPVVKLIPGQIYLLGDDKQAHIKLKNVKASVYMEEGKWVLMELSPGELTVNGEPMPSVELRKNLRIQLGQYELEYIIGGKKKEKQDVKERDYSRILLWGGAGLFMLFYLMMLSGGDDAEQTDASSNSNNAAEVTTDFGSGAGSGLPQNPEYKKMDDEVFALYQQGLSYYDQGKLKSALLTMLKAAAQSPQNTLIQSKVNDWEDKLDKEITRYYQQGCFDLQYLRYYEAENVFRVLKGLSYDESDPRYREAERILSALENGAEQGLVCGEAQ